MIIKNDTNKNIELVFDYIAGALTSNLLAGETNDYPLVGIKKITIRAGSIKKIKLQKEAENEQEIIAMAEN